MESNDQLLERGRSSEKSFIVDPQTSTVRPTKLRTRTWSTSSSRSDSMSPSAQPNRRQAAYTMSDGSLTAIDPSSSKVTHVSIVESGAGNINGLRHENQDDNEGGNDVQSLKPKKPLPNRHLPTLTTTLLSRDRESVLALVADPGWPILKCDEEVPESAMEDDEAEGGEGHESGKERWERRGDVVRREGRYAFSGNQSEDIHVWDLSTLLFVRRLEGHTSSVLCLEIAPEMAWLFSSSGDNTTRIWHTETFHCLYVIEPPHDNVGDILSLAWISCPRKGIVPAAVRTQLSHNRQNGPHFSYDTKGKAKDVTDEPDHDHERDHEHALSFTDEFAGRLYVGCQDASVQWIDIPIAFPPPADSPAHSPTLPSRSQTPNLNPNSLPIGTPPLSTTATRSGYSTPHSLNSSAPKLPHKFFDSVSQSDRMRAAVRKAARSERDKERDEAHKRVLEAEGKLLSHPDGSPEKANSDSGGNSLPKLDISKDDDEIVAEEVGYQPITIEISAEDVVSYAHHGYVYALAVATLPSGFVTRRKREMSRDGTLPQDQLDDSEELDGECKTRGRNECGRQGERTVLISGGGDEDVKVWTLHQRKTKHLRTLSSNSGAVMSFEVRDCTLFAGHQGGTIKIWDLETMTSIRTLAAQNEDVLALGFLGKDFFSASACGHVTRWSPTFNRMATWKAHDGIVLSLSTLVNNGRKLLLTGGSDNCIKVWDVAGEDGSTRRSNHQFQGRMFHVLSRLISFPSVASDAHREDCRQAALYLKKALGQLGAEAMLLPVPGNRNPLVLAKFGSGREFGALKPKKKVLFYGHYDVFGVPSRQEWDTDPWQLTGKLGFVYGRGVTDNKGPILAVASAASSLLEEKTLDVELTMLIEGEEENGSVGFQEAVRTHRDLIGDADVVLVSNSYWIGDHPCMTWGLRGVVHATLEITSSRPSLHSGIHGGIVREPLVDMCQLLSTLSDQGGRVRIPGFFEQVRPLDQQEEAIYDRILKRCKCDPISQFTQYSDMPDEKAALLSRWREPSFSIHQIEVGTPAQPTIIPSSAKSSISLRLVPDQDLDTMVAGLEGTLRDSFKNLSSPNQLHVHVRHVADWWLGEHHSREAELFTNAIKAEWGVDPLWIREGGSIPSLPFLEREFGAKALHFPMGMNSDAAHLANERIRVVNLERGKNVVARWLKSLPG